jgi:cell wall-associated NlpC family hydrolase
VTPAEGRAAVVAEAKTWLGTPWIHQARDKGYGVDCGQLLAAVFEAVGLVEPVPIAPYSQDWALHRSEPIMQNIVERYAVKTDGDPLPGDVVLFQFGRSLSHGGIVLLWPLIVHAYLNERAVVVGDVSTNPDLLERLAGRWTVWPGDTDGR